MPIFTIIRLPNKKNPHQFGEDFVEIYNLYSSSLPGQCRLSTKEEMP
jgi:hypothetical protein